MKKLNSFTLKELEDYLGITDNENYMYKAKTIMDFRLLADLFDGQDIEIILKQDYFTQKLNETSKIIYEYNDLIVYK